MVRLAAGVDGAADGGADWAGGDVSGAATDGPVLELRRYRPPTVAATTTAAANPRRRVLVMLRYLHGTRKARR